MVTITCLMFSFSTRTAWKKRLWRAPNGQAVRQFMGEQFGEKIDKKNRMDFPDELASEVWRYQDDSGSFTVRFFDDDNNRVILEAHDGDHPPVWWQLWEMLGKVSS